MSERTDAARPLVLASTSPYRRELLQRLRIPFEVCAPEVDEQELAGESPPELARRLALAKARAIAQRKPQALVIGSDQVAELDGEALGKPGSHANALAQLRRMSGRVVSFHTAVALVCEQSGFTAQDLAPVRVRFRSLSERMIEQYLAAEQPYDCAGSAKAESLGIALLESIESDDPTALIGLPLIRLCSMLERASQPVLEAVPA